MKARRDPVLDVVRILAFFTVICVHFFLNCGFYANPVGGKGMYVMVLCRTAFMVCVPLFILLTGWLSHTKTLTPRHYKGVIRIVTGWFLSSCLCTLFIHCYLSGAGVTGQSLWDCVRDFRGAPYGWYVEMHFGLFLLIPFLNLTYHGLQTKKRKLALIVTLLVCTALPPILNSFSFESLSWWAQPSQSYVYEKLLPGWWMGIYPLTYYFIGAWLSEYRPKVKPLPVLLLLVANVVLAGSFNFWRSLGTIFSYGPWQDWGSLQNVVSSVLVFLLVTCLDGSGWSDRVKKVLSYLSGLTLSAYLVSYIFDSLFYPHLNAAVEAVTHRLLWFPVIVPLVAVCSLALAAAVEGVNGVLVRLIDRAGTHILPSVFGKPAEKPEN